MKQSIFLFSILCCSLFAQSQEKLLTKRIVYLVDITENVVKQEKNKDTIVSNYKVNERFWWESMDVLMQKWKEGDLKVYNHENKILVWDTMLRQLNTSLERYFKRKLDAKQVQNILDNNINKVEFEEEWTYSPTTMLINKKVLSYTPIIAIDSLYLTDEGFATKNAFLFPLGTIKQNNSIEDTNNLLLITRNIQYTIPIYNYEPYLWWKSNLEEEYSLPYFETMINKAENMEIPIFEGQDQTEALQKHSVLKRRNYTTRTQIIEDLGENMTNEYDTIINLKYNAEDIDYLKFGEEVYFDKTNMTFLKKTNYLSPMISIKDNKGEFLYYYPLYYIRKK
ncbi:MAG: hypothetical protein Q4Q06_06430 [Bacteroidota bacterium]|nr:hypothetical protein [Bacteroidota bacterium]